MLGVTTRCGNLPSDLTSFVGRRRELAEVRRLLGESRLVTLTGIGGVGKTRLALRAAAELDRRFPDGVWLVDLAPLRDPALVAQTVAAELGIRDESTRWSVTVLAHYVSDRHLLLLLDNCEHLLDPCAVLADTLLRAARRLRVLVTSRQPLGVPGECTFIVPPLSVPDPDRSSPPTPEALGQAEAVRLLVERASAVAPQFAIAEDNAEAVTRLVQRLDGIPLALELAAARLRVLSPQQIVDRLDDRYRLLSSGARTARPQQQSLQALIDWSFSLCSAAERTLWARLSVFPRDFDVDAAEEICSGDGLAREGVLDALAGLVDKSVLLVERQGPRVRYRLLETLRAYGRDRLAGSGNEMVLRRRHRDYYRRLAERAGEEWFGPRQVTWTALMQAEYVNVRAALEFCLAEPGEAAAGLDMFSAALGTYWWISGSLAEGRRFLDRVLATQAEPSVGRARALWVLAWVAINQGDLAAAVAAGQESRREAQRYDDGGAYGIASMFLGYARMLGGDLSAAEPLFRDALQTGGGQAPLVAASALCRLAQLSERRGDVVAATTHYQECVTICETHGESWVRAYALWSWALLAWEHGDTVQATTLARESLRARVTFHDRVGIAQCLEVLGWIATAESAYDRAARLLGAAGSVWKQAGAALFPDLAVFHDRCAAQARRAIGARAFTEAVRQGAHQTLDDAVAYALAEKPEAVPAMAAPTGGLTRREREIADLVAQGLSNRDIAAKLVIAQRTAEGHVEHILAKLAFTSRTQIAAWVAARRAGPD
jgi:predicted ATPase/DNA-binding NarL/FixJ family response regulator